MNSEKCNQLAWNLFVELRKEIVESQRVRAQIVGVKITFLGASVGLIVANLAKNGLYLLVVPAFAAIFFDFLLINYSASIKRIGRYTLLYVEPQLRSDWGWPAHYPLWEGYMAMPGTRGPAAVIGNIGLTGLVLLPSVGLILGPYSFPYSPLVAAALMILFAIDLTYSWRVSRRDPHGELQERAAQQDACS